MPNAKATVVVGAEIGDFKRKMLEVNKTLKSTRERFSKDYGELQAVANRTALALGAVAIGSGLVGRSMLTAAGNMEQNEIAFTTMLGSAEKAKAFLKELQDFAAKTPFDLPGILAASRKLLAFGFTGESIIPMLTSIGDAAAAAGGGPEVIDRITTAIGQMQAKQKVSAEEMMQLTEAGIPAWDMLAKGIGKTTAETMKLAEQGKISAGTGIPALLGGMSQRFGGLMGKQADTLQGRWSNFKDTMGQIAVTMGSMLLPVAKRVLEMMQRLADWVSGLSDKWKKVIAFGGAALGGIAGFGAIALSVVARILPYLSQIGAVLRTAFAIARGPIGWIIMGLGLVYDWLRRNKPAMDQLKGTISSLWSTVSGHWSKVSRVFAQFKPVISGVFVEVKRLVDNLIAAIWPLIHAWIQWQVIQQKVFGPITLGVFNAVIQAVKVLLSWLGKVISALNWIIEKAEKLFGLAGGSGGQRTIQGLLSGNLVDASLQAIKNAMGNVNAKMPEAPPLEGVPEAPKEERKPEWTDLRSLWNKAMVAAATPAKVETPQVVEAKKSNSLLSGIKQSMDRNNNLLLNIQNNTKPTTGEAW